MSGAAAGFPADMWRPVLTLLAAIAAFAGTRAVIRDGGLDKLMAALTWIASGISFLGIVGVAFHAFPWAMRAQGLWRASSTLTYANAMGAVLTLAIPAALIRRARHESALHRLHLYAIVLGLVTTLSRGAAMGAIAFAIVLACTGGGRLLKQLVRPAVAAICAAVALFPSIASWWPRPIHATIGLVAGAVIALAPPLRWKPAISRAAGVAMLLAAAGAAIPAVAATQKPAQFVVSRLSGRSDDRTIFWRASLKSAAAHPILGTGPGTYRGIIDDRGRELMVFYVHNEYLQTFAETGAVGLASVLGAVAIFALWAWRRRPARGTPARAVWSASVAACAAFCVHGSFDFMWRLPAIVVLAFVWLAVAVETRERDITC